MVSACIYVLCPGQQEYEAAQIEYTKPWEKPILLPQTHWLEGIMYVSELMRRYDEWKDKDYVGCIAHCAHKKQPKIHDIESILKEGKENESQVVAFMGRRVIDIVMNGDLYHPGFRDGWNATWKSLGYDPIEMSKPCFSFFCNYWCSTPGFMMFYCSMLAYLNEKIQHVPELKSILWRNAMYSDAKLHPDKLRALFGVPYYPLLPFIVERMICAFASKHAKTITFIP
jgi:hypothetical protein